MAEEERVKQKAEKKRLKKKVTGRGRSGSLEGFGCGGSFVRVGHNSRCPAVDPFARGPKGLRDCRVSQRPFVATVLGSHYIPVLKSAFFLLKTS